jgi:RNA polymerase sigma-70 factor (ECF subfamily)
VDETLSAAVRRARAGIEVEEAFRVLDSLLRPRLLGYFRSSSLPREDAEDLVQKTLARVFRSIGGLENEESFLAWLFAIARNVRRTAEEKRRREAEGVALPEEIVDPRPSTRMEEEEIERKQQEVHGAIERLPARQRQCLALQVRDGLSYEEIAGTLRLSAHTVRNHLAAARENLRKQLREDGEKARRE